MAYKEDNIWLEMLWILALFLSSAATALTMKLLEFFLGSDLPERAGILGGIGYLVFFAAYVILFRYKLLYNKFESAKNDPYFGMRDGGPF